MEFKQVTPFRSILSQLSISDPGMSSARGLRAIINNRPDGGADDEPDRDELAAAAVRKRAPTEAVNALAVLSGAIPIAVYDGHRSCPLTAERGTIVPAGFAYGGEPLPGVPGCLVDGCQAGRRASLIMETVRPPLYLENMLQGREWPAVRCCPAGRPRTRLADPSLAATPGTC